YKCEVSKNWVKFSIQRNPLANCDEMVRYSHGRLIMIGDHTNNNVMIVEKLCKLLDYWAQQFPGGHGISIAKEGDEDFLYLTDCGYFVDRNGNTQRQSGYVSKTTLDGRLVFHLSHPKALGIYKENEPFMPTETAIAPNGDIYVAYGYGSDYIIQFD